MNDSEQLCASMVINGPADEIFALLADPNRHRVIDGSGMLRGPYPGTTPVSQAGQTFTMNMRHPRLGDYQMINTVTSFEPEFRISWAPHLHPSSRILLRTLRVARIGGHTFTFELRTAEDGKTTVTEIYDWSGVDDPDFAKICPLITEEQLAGTLGRIAKHVE